MKSLPLFLQTVLEDLGDWCSISTSRDYEYVMGRFEREGLEFLTITLPTFGKDLEKGLEQEVIAPDQFASFRKSGRLPLFMGGFLELVFDRTDGALLHEPNVHAIKAIRQLTLMFAKIEKECSQGRTNYAFTKFMLCEQHVRDTDALPDRPEKLAALRRMSNTLWSELFSAVNQQVALGEILPKHGSGATADGLRGNAKYDLRTWTERLEEHFSFGEMVFPSWHHFIDAPHVLLEPEAEMPVKVIAVPKTQSTPRIIGIEPTCMQYMQQAILESISDATEVDDIASWLISSVSQEPNQLLAHEGSLHGNLATLDLSEASDRVSNQHVRAILAPYGPLAGAVDASRSRKADVPNHGVKRLAKFASMGSALCFPFEAIVFATVVFLGIERGLNASTTLDEQKMLTRKDIKSFKGKVRVYGDDIIVPVHYVDFVIDELVAYGFEVNVNKSFWNGKFRESCGKDYYDGIDVSIVRLRSEFPTSRKQASELASTVSLRNQLFLKSGFDRTVGLLDEIVGGLIPFPYVEDSCSALGRLRYEGFETQSMHATLHTPLVKAVRLVPKLPKSNLQDSGALMKWFLKRGDLPFPDRNHLMFAGRSVSFNIKTRMVRPY